MKQLKLNIILIILLFSFSCYGQDTILIGDSFKTFNGLRALGLIKEDVFTLFNLKNNYDTDLKKKMYLESEEGSKLKDSLINLKNNLGNLFFIMGVVGKFESYDLAKQGLILKLDETWINEYCSFDNFNNKLQNVNLFCFANITFEPIKHSAMAYKTLFIPLEEKEAIDLENKDITVTFIFNLTGNICEMKEESMFGGYTNAEYPETKNVTMELYKNRKLLSAYRFQ